MKLEQIECQHEKQDEKNPSFLTRDTPLIEPWETQRRKHFSSELCDFFFIFQ